MFQPTCKYWYLEDPHLFTWTPAKKPPKIENQQILVISDLRLTVILASHLRDNLLSIHHILGAVNPGSMLNPPILCIIRYIY